jgi:hypothetical protein
MIVSSMQLLMILKRISYGGLEIGLTGEYFRLLDYGKEEFQRPHQRQRQNGHQDWVFTIGYIN